LAFLYFFLFEAILTAEDAPTFLTNQLKVICVADLTKWTDELLFFEFVLED
jgi:hypothetical protein